jgi:hypothetical protein
LYYQNWHITLTKSRNKTASATAAAASHHQVCMMAMAIKPVKKKNKNKNQHFLCVPWLPTPRATFYFIGEIKKFEIRKPSDFGVLQSPEVRIARTCSQIWLNLFRDDRHFFYFFLWMIATLATNKKSFKKKNWCSLGRLM